MTTLSVLAGNPKVSPLSTRLPQKLTWSPSTCIASSLRTGFRVLHIMANDRAKVSSDNPVRLNGSLEKFGPHEKGDRESQQHKGRSKPGVQFFRVSVFCREIVYGEGQGLKLVR